MAITDKFDLRCFVSSFMYSLEDRICNHDRIRCPSTAFARMRWDLRST
jgi:hypothetical protein